MLLKEKNHHLFLLKATQNNVLTPLRIEQYIDTFTHCIVATLLRSAGIY